MASDTLQPVQEFENTISMQIPIMSQSASNTRPAEMNTTRTEHNRQHSFKDIQNAREQQSLQDDFDMFRASSWESDTVLKRLLKPTPREPAILIPKPDDLAYRFEAIHNDPE